MELPECAAPAQSEGLFCPELSLLGASAAFGQNPIVSLSS